MGGPLLGRGSRAVGADRPTANPRQRRGTPPVGSVAAGGDVARPKHVLTSCRCTCAGSVLPPCHLLGLLGLPDSVRACLFDLDGVLTRTATVHFAAWKRTFDEFLQRARARSAGVQPGRLQPLRRRQAPGRRRPRLPGQPGDHPARGRAGRRPARRGDRAGRSPRARTSWCSPSSTSTAWRSTPVRCDYLRAVKDAGLRDGGGDGVGQRGAGHRRRRVRRSHRRPRRRCRRRPGRAARQAGAGHLPGRRPRCWASSRREAVVFEDAISGVAAGRAGNFGYVVGVDRVGQAEA